MRKKWKELKKEFTAKVEDNKKLVTIINNMETKIKEA